MEYLNFLVCGEESYRVHSDFPFSVGDVVVIDRSKFQLTGRVLYSNRDHKYASYATVPHYTVDSSIEFLATKID